MMQCERVVKMLLRSTGQVFQPVVFCRVISTMQGLMCFMVFHLALVRSLCLLGCYYYTGTVLYHNQCREMPEKWSFYNTVLLDNVLVWECILHLLDGEAAVRWNKTLFLKPVQKSTREFCVVVTSQCWCPLGFHCGTESVKGITIPWAELG